MRSIFGLFILLSVLSACQDDPLDYKVSQCPSSDRQYSRTSAVTDVSAMVKIATINNQPIGGYWIQPSGSSQIAPWSACNLPVQFQKDSSQIIVSGYILTYPELELLNIAALPFEVTVIRGKK